MVPSTNLTRDIYQRFINPNAGGTSIIWFQRVMIVLLAGVTLLVTTQFENILDMALYAYTMVGAAVTPALLAAFLWRRVTPAGGAAPSPWECWAPSSSLVWRAWVSNRCPGFCRRAPGLRLHHLPSGCSLADLAFRGQLADPSVPRREVEAFLVLTPEATVWAVSGRLIVTP